MLVRDFLSNEHFTAWLIYTPAVKTSNATQQRLIGVMVARGRLLLNASPCGGSPLSYWWE
jgi:hypothetical protein